MHGIMHLPLRVYSIKMGQSTLNKAMKKKEKLKTKWLEFAQFIDSTNNIHICRENTFTIDRESWNSFAFDANMEFFSMASAGCHN